jgi:hypothetical protein
MVRSELLKTVSESMMGRCDVASVSGNPIVGYRIRDLRILSGDVVVATIGRLRLRVDPLRCCAAGPRLLPCGVGRIRGSSPRFRPHRPSDSDAFPASLESRSAGCSSTCPSAPFPSTASRSARCRLAGPRARHGNALLPGPSRFARRRAASGRNGGAPCRSGRREPRLDGPLTGAPFSIVASVPDLSKLAPLLPSETPALSGKAAASLRVAPKEPNIVAGRLSFADMTAASLDIPVAAASFGFDGRKFSVASLDATVMGTRVAGNGASSSPRIRRSTCRSGPPTCR